MQKNERLKDKKIAILATNGFEYDELTSPRDAIRDAGGTPVVISPESGEIRGWKGSDWADSVSVDRTLDEANVSDFDGLVLPGGVINPDLLRSNEAAVKFVRAFFDDGKPVAAICHGPWLLAEAGVAKDRELTSYASIRTDMENAGAKWVDREVVVDAGLVTSRSPEDLEAFNEKAVEEFCEGYHREQELQAKAS